MFLLVHNAQYVHVAMNEPASRSVTWTGHVKDSPGAFSTAVRGYLWWPVKHSQHTGESPFIVIFRRLCGDQGTAGCIGWA
jgi:hypothetical protein